MQVSDIPLEIQANLVKALKQLLEKGFSLCWICINFERED